MACGGDGTVHAIAKLLVHKDSMLGVLPLGSGNDFAKMVSTDSFTSSYLTILEQGSVARFDSIAWNNDICINTFGLGIDGLTNQIASNNTIFKGKLKYVVAALKAIFKVSKNTVTVSIDDINRGDFDTYLTLISNGCWEGGSYQLSPNSKLDDGVFELHIAKIDTKLQLLLQFIRLSLIGSFSKHILKSFECKQAHLAFNETIHAHCDGEVIEPFNEVAFKILPASLKVLVQHCK